MAVKEKTTVRDVFKSIPEDITFSEFLSGEGLGDFNKKLRKSLESTGWTTVDYSEKTLINAGWTKFEAEYLNKAFDKVKKDFVTTYGKENIKILGNSKLIITAPLNLEGVPRNQRIKSAFQSAGLIFDKTKILAAELLIKDFKGRKPTKAQIKNINSKLAKYERRIEREAREARGEVIAGPPLLVKAEPLTDKELLMLAYSRLQDVAGGKLSVDRGHLEDHENLRLAAATRLAIGIQKFGKDKLPEEFVEDILIKIGVNRENFIKLQDYVDARVKGKRLDTARFTHHVTIELSTKNQGEKNEAILARQVLSAADEKFVEWTALNSVVESFYGSGLSPSIINRVEDFLITVLTGGKGKTKRADLYRNKSRKKYKPEIIKIKGGSLANRIAPSPKRKGKKLTKSDISTAVKNLPESSVIDTLRIRNLINEVMDVEAEMADSGSSDGRLRYQTGRFADSAKLLTLTRTQAGVLAGTYTYMRDPYDVFLPGHKLGTPKRDPRIYVEGAIRKAAIKTIGKRFPGIVLELQ